MSGAAKGIIAGRPTGGGPAGGLSIYKRLAGMGAGLGGARLRSGIASTVGQIQHVLGIVEWVLFYETTG